MELYRYEDTAYANMIDEDFAGHSTHIRISLREFPVVKDNPKSHWIRDRDGFCRRVSKTSKKRFAHPTKDEAWLSFRKRKEAQMRIYREKLRRAQVAYSLPRPDVATHYAAAPDLISEPTH
jgi:hypothetical protein